MNDRGTSDQGGSGRAGLLTLLAGAVCLWGCSGGGLNPFGADPEDKAREAALSRLREIRTTTLESSRIDPSASGATTSAAATLEELRARFADAGATNLSLEECRAAALENNLDLRVAVVSPTLLAEREREEEARFEGAFTLRGGLQYFDRATASSLVSGQSNSQNITPAVTIPTRTGGSVSVGLPISRSNNDNSFTTLNPAYTSDLEFTISHELLRNAGRRAQTASLRIAGYNRQAEEARTKLEVIRLLADADKAYWRLYQFRQELDVRQRQLELAQAQLQRAQRRFDAGEGPEIDVIQAQAGVAERLEGIILAHNAVLVQQRTLKRAMNRGDLPVEGSTAIVPATPPDPVQYAFDTPALVAQAVANRMEMLELELRLAADAASIGLARNQTLPRAALEYTYRINGLGSSGQDSFSTMASNDFEDWTVGFQAEVPLGNEAAKSRLRQAILTRLQRLSTRAAREQRIREEVLNAVDTLDAGWQRVLASRQSVILSTRALQAQQRRFDVGEATTTDVLDAATSLANAQSSEIAALVNYQIVQIDLAFATGTLLGAAKIAWAPAPTATTGGDDPREELPEPVMEPEDGGRDQTLPTPQPEGQPEGQPEAQPEGPVQP